MTVFACSCRVKPNNMPTQGEMVMKVAKAGGDTRRQLLFLELLPKHNFNIKRAAIEAGYTEKTADRQGKRILKTALATSMRLQAEALSGDAKQEEEKETMPIVSLSSKEIVEEMKNPDSILSIVGYSKDSVISHYKYVVEQEKDMNAKLKALAPLLRVLGIELNPDEQGKTVVPQLFIGVEEVKKEALQGPESIDIASIPTIPPNSSL